MKMLKCGRSLRNADIKTIRFPEDEIAIETYFVINKGIPEPKICDVRVIKCLPGGKEEIIATG